MLCFNLLWGCYPVSQSSLAHPTFVHWDHDQYPMKWKQATCWKSAAYVLSSWRAQEKYRCCPNGLCLCLQEGDCGHGLPFNISCDNLHLVTGNFTFFTKEVMD